MPDPSQPPRTPLWAWLMYWTMFIIGGGGVALGLLLPAWIDYRDARTAYETRLSRNATLAGDIERVHHQIARHGEDAAYAERIAQQEFNLHLPGVQRLILPIADADTLVPPLPGRDGNGRPGESRHATEPPEAANGAQNVTTSVAAGDDESERQPLAPLLPAEVEQRVDGTLHEERLLGLFLHPKTRPMLMALSAFLLVVAIMALFEPRRVVLGSLTHK